MANREKQILEGLKKFSGKEKLEITVSPGTATSEQIGELLAEISILYRMMGGAGLTFSKDQIKILINS